jgi:hypothetical protein
MYQITAKSKTYRRNIIFSKKKRKSIVARRTPPSNPNQFSRACAKHADYPGVFLFFSLLICEKPGVSSHTLHH